MTVFQLLMLGASAFFAYKIYEHIQTLKDSETEGNLESETTPRTADSFSTSNASSLIEKADAEREKGNLDKALAIYSEAKIKEPENAEVLFKMGYTLSLQERDEEALEYFTDALEQDDANPFTHQAMASIYRKEGKFALAQKHLQRSLELNSEDRVSYYNYGNLLVDMKEFDKAKEMYAKALEIDPDFKEAKAELEKLHSEQ